MHKQRSPPTDLRTKYITSVSCLLLSLPLHFPDPCFSTVHLLPFPLSCISSAPSSPPHSSQLGLPHCFPARSPQKLKASPSFLAALGVHLCWGAGASSLLQQAEPYNVCQQPCLEITRFIVVPEEMVIQSS